MSKGARIFLVVAVIWWAAWAAGSFAFFSAAEQARSEADYLGLPITSLTPGEPVRFEGSIAAEPPAFSMRSHKPCVATETTVHYVTRYLDSQDKTQEESLLLSSSRIGPTVLGIVAGGRRVDLPLELWNGRDVVWESSREWLTERPDGLVTPEQVREIERRSRGTFAHFLVVESMLVADSEVFVAGRLAEGRSPLRLEADPVLGRVELHPGTQLNLVESKRGSSFGMKIAGWVFAALGPVPLLIFGLLRLRRSRRGIPRNAKAPTGPHDLSAP